MKTLFITLLLAFGTLSAQNYTSHMALHVFPNGDSVITQGKTMISIDLKNKTFSQKTEIPEQTQSYKILSREKPAKDVEKCFMIEKTGAAETYNCKVELFTPKTTSIFNTKYRQLLVMHEKGMTVFYYLD